MKLGLLWVLQTQGTTSIQMLQQQGPVADSAQTEDCLCGVASSMCLAARHALKCWT